LTGQKLRLIHVAKNWQNNLESVVLYIQLEQQNR